MEWREIPRGMQTNSSDRKTYLSGEYPHTANDHPHSPHPRALEGIKDKLRVLSERSSAADYKQNEVDTSAACDLADDLRDAVVEYQVGTGIKPYTEWPTHAVCRLLSRRPCTS